MKKELLDDVRSLLEYHQSMGLKEIPAGKSVPSGDASNQKKLDDLRELIGDCTRCRLNEGRTNLVFGVGNPNADLMFVGEGPGRDEDLKGEPFVGRAGQLLNRIIEAMGYKRKDVYIGNIVKCRPPQNRNPAPDEAATCIPFLVGQIEIIQPKVIVCLGSVAVQFLLQTEQKISQLRGNIHEWNGIPVMPTYHPAFLLRNPNMKKPVWEDMQKVMEMLKE
jgi:DNA polymerase